MTSVAYVFEADVLDLDTNLWLPLPITGITITLDKDYVPYARAELSLGPLTTDMVELLDPRTLNPTLGGPVRWKITQTTPTGETIATLPDTGYARMWPRTITRNLNGSVLTLFGGESLLDDAINASNGPILCVDARGPNAWGKLVSWGLERVVGSTDVHYDEAAKRVEFAPACAFVPEIGSGQSFLDLIENELQAHSLRLYDIFGTWWVGDRDNPPHDGGTIRLGSYTPAPEGVTPIITGFTETRTRDGLWSDSIVIRSAVQTYGDWTHMTASTPDPTKATVIDVPLQISIGGELAGAFLARRLRQGRDVQITARPLLTPRPGMTLETHLADETLTADISAITWDLPTGTMTINTQSAVTLPDIETAVQFMPATITEAANKAATQAVQAAMPNVTLIAKSVVARASQPSVYNHKPIR